MAGKAPVLTGMTEAATGDVEAAGFRDDTCRDEDEGKRGQNEQSSAVEEAQNKSETTEHFQPRQVEGKTNADRPRQHFVIVDVGGKPKWIKRLDHPRVNENAADDEVDNAPDELRSG